MSEAQIAVILLELAALLAMTYALAGVLVRARIPPILAALLVAMAARYTTVGARLLSPELYPAFDLLAQIGVLFLLLFIGLQVDLSEMRRSGRDIVWCTVLNTTVPFVLGTAAMLTLGYGWVLAFVIGLTRMPTAEAVIVPILDEFRLVRSRVGDFIVGTGVLDDVIEVALVAVVSVWIGGRAASGTAAGGMSGEIVGIVASIMVFLATAWLCYRWLPRLSRWLPRRPRNLMMLSMVALFAFGGFTEYYKLGMVVGAITAGVVLRPVFNAMGAVGEETTKTISTTTYGFFGLVFFFWIGLSVDLGTILRSPMLAVLLFLTAFVGKLIGVLLMVPMKKLSTLEAWTIGIGLNARLTTEIIVARLLLTAGLIDEPLFTALVAASSISTIIVPLLFSLIVRKWGDQLRTRHVAVHITPKDRVDE